MQAVIYKITSPSKRIYIGSTVDYERRLKEYRSLHCSGQVRLISSFRKYGVKKHLFEIVEYCDCGSMKQREAYYGHLYAVLGKHGLNCNLPKHNELF